MNSSSHVDRQVEVYKLGSYVTERQVADDVILLETETMCPDGGMQGHGGPSQLYKCV